MARPNRGPYLKKDRKTGIYYIHWCERGRSKRRSAGTTNRHLAEEKLEHFLRQARLSRRPDGGWKVQQAWDVYRTERVEPRAQSVDRIAGIWRRSLLPHFGDRVIADLDVSDIDEFKRARADAGLAQSTIRLELSSFVSCMNWLIKTKRMPSDEAPYVELPQKPPPRLRWLTAEEIDRIHQTATRMRESGPEPERLSRLERFLHIGLATGSRCRVVEILQWPSVDFDRGFIDFGSQQVQTKKRRPVVPMSSTLRTVLKRAYAERRSPYVLDATRRIRYEFSQLVAEAGLDKNVTPNTLRHTFASHAVMNGASYTDVARVLGNTAAMVESVYAKFQPDYLQHVVDMRPVRLKVVE